MIGPEPRPSGSSSVCELMSGPLISGSPANCQSASVSLCFICLLASVNGVRRWKWDLDHALRETAQIGRSKELLPANGRYSNDRA